TPPRGGARRSGGPPRPAQKRWDRGCRQTCSNPWSFGARAARPCSALRRTFGPPAGVAEKRSGSAQPAGDREAGQGGEQAHGQGRDDVNGGTPVGALLGQADRLEVERGVSRE